MKMLLNFNQLSMENDFNHDTNASLARRASQRRREAPSVPNLPRPS